MKHQIKNKEKLQVFFCKMNKFPIRYALFTNNHVLNELSLKIVKKIYFEYLEKSSNGYKKSKKQLKITEERRVFTNKELDYTCIEFIKFAIKLKFIFSYLISKSQLSFLNFSK